MSPRWQDGGPLRKDEKTMKIAKYLTAASALAVALAVTGAELAASAQTTTTASPTTTTATPVPANLPPDQLVLTGSCISGAVAYQTAEEAIDEYAPGDQPAGVYVNGMWLPAPYLLASGGTNIVGTLGCVNDASVPTTVATTTTTTT